jgi:hypothetical protein
MRHNDQFYPIVDEKQCQFTSIVDEKHNDQLSPIVDEKQ